MLKASLTIATAAAVAFLSGVPAFARMNGTDYLNYLDVARRAERSLGSAPAAKTGAPSHRYVGGPTRDHELKR